MPVNSISFCSASASSMTLSSTAANATAASGEQAPLFQLPTDILEIGSASSMSLSMTYTAQGLQGGQAPSMDTDMAEVVIALLMLAMMSGDTQSMDQILKLLTGQGDEQGGEAASMQSMSLSMSFSSSSYAMASTSDASAPAIGASVDMAA